MNAKKLAKKYNLLIIFIIKTIVNIHCVEV